MVEVYVITNTVIRIRISFARNRCHLDSLYNYYFHPARKMANESQISTFYSGQKIFITGATGFVGKVLLWKLLHSCPLVDTIYVLIRERRGKKASARLEELLNLRIFQMLRRNDASVFEKVVAVCGDTGEANLGLSADDRNRLLEEVSIVFHGAANLSMNANLKEALNTNTVGTRQLLDLALQMKNLMSFVYISTGFCCCDNSVVEEKFYSLKENVDDVISFTQYINHKVLAKITREIIRPLPNTYVYSKRLAEVLVAKYSGKLPIQVARPTIVSSSMKEPEPGFLANLNGPPGLLIAVGKGVLRSILCSRDCTADGIPADILCNGLIAIPWAESKHSDWRDRDTPVYNLSFTGPKPLQWGEFNDVCIQTLLQEPFEVMLWYPSVNVVTTNKLFHTFRGIFYQYIPAYVIDFILRMLNKRPFMVKIQKQISAGMLVFQYFTTNEWTFKHDNILRIEDSMSDADKRVFAVTMGEFDLKRSLRDVLRWVKQHYLKEKPNNVAKCRRRLTIMYFVSWIFNVIFYVVLFKLLLRIYQKCF